MEPIVIATITINVPCEQIIYEFVHSYINYVEQFYKSFVGFGDYHDDRQYIVYLKSQTEINNSNNDLNENCIANVWIDGRYKNQISKYVDKVINLHTHHRKLTINEIDC